VDMVAGGWLSLELISQVVRVGTGGVVSRARPHSRVGSARAGYRPERRPKNPPSRACRGATVKSASSVAAREVLLADAANLLPNIFRAGQGRSHMPLYVVKAVGRPCRFAGARNPGRESAPSIESVVRPREVTR
jgi:hypothetical protein